MKKRTISIISAVIGAILGVIAGAGTVAKITGQVDEKNEKLAEKHLALYLMMNQWVKIKQEGKNLSSYLIKNGYKKIAIYGMSYAGETLVSELQGTDITIEYGIDKNANGIYSDIDILSIEEKLGDVDAIIVTAITFFDEIEEQLSQKINCPIISLEDILYEL